MGIIRDGQQDERIRELEGDANSTVDSLATFADALAKERKRNDVQSERIKALTTLCEKLVDRLTASGAVPATEIALELAELRRASAPRKL